MNAAPNKNSQIKVKKRRNKKSCKIRASHPAPDSLGSITVEAALSGWIFLTAMLSIISVLQIFSTYGIVQQCLWDAGRKIGVSAEADAGIGVLYPQFIQSMNKNIGRDSGITGGIWGVSLAGSHIDTTTGEMEIRAVYRIKPSLLYLPGIYIPMRHQVFMKVWSGYHGEYDGDGSSNSDENKTVFFVAENESVYHTSAQCTHLHLSISMVDINTVKTKRNANGSCYHACEKCHSEDSTGMVYITETGDKYHSSLQCSGIKRTIHEVTDVGQLRRCSRCGGNG